MTIRRKCKEPNLVVENMRLRIELRDLAADAKKALEARLAQESYADWVARTNAGIAAINARIRKSSNWSIAGARVG